MDAKHLGSLVMYNKKVVSLFLFFLGLWDIQKDIPRMPVKLYCTENTFCNVLNLLEVCMYVCIHYIDLLLDGPMKGIVKISLNLYSASSYSAFIQH